MVPETELRRLEQVRIRTLALVEGVSQEELDRRPAGGGWSVGEVLDHLLRAEAANREQIAALVELARAGREPLIRRSLTPDALAPAFI
ncbi:MAG: DinB family protein, partial [Candidatus Rokuibacteriota bacterium]